MNLEFAEATDAQVSISTKKIEKKARIPLPVNGGKTMCKWAIDFHGL